MVRPLPLGALVAMLLASLAFASGAAAQGEPVPPPAPAPEQPAQQAPPTVITDPEAAIEEGGESQQEVLGDRGPHDAAEPGAPNAAPAPAQPAPVAEAAPAAPAPAAAAPGQLPFTGLSAGWIALMGASMLLLGVSLHRRTEGIDEG